jgi:hypothetical protein
MQAVCSTTRPRRYDTKPIVLGKLLQLLSDGPTGAANTGAVVRYPDTGMRRADTELISLQKTLQQENGA